MDTITEKIGTDEKQATDSKDVLRRACAAVGSLKEFEFDIRFNADVFSPGIQHVDDEAAPNSLKKQKKLVTEAAQFLLITQIPTFVRDCMDHSSAPMDGSTLTETLHNRGINIRYLGKVTILLAKIPKLEASIMFLQENIYNLHTFHVCELTLCIFTFVHVVFAYHCRAGAYRSSGQTHFLRLYAKH